MTLALRLTLMSQYLLRFCAFSLCLSLAYFACRLCRQKLLSPHCCWSSTFQYTFIYLVTPGGVFRLFNISWSGQMRTTPFELRCVRKKRWDLVSMQFLVPLQATCIQDLTLSYCTLFLGCKRTDVHLRLSALTYAWKALCNKLSLSGCLLYIKMFPYVFRADANTRSCAI